MNKENIKKSALYEMLCKITWKNKKAIQVYFWRNKMSIDNKDDFINYIEKRKIL